MGPIQYSGLDETDARLLAARARFPGWNIYRALLGYLAVPSGTDVYVASTVESITAKLAESTEGES